MDSIAHSDSILDAVKDSLGMSMQIGDRVKDFTMETRLLGDLPELDSMAILTVITGLEEYFDFEIDADDITADTFETVGSLVAFLQEQTG